MYFSYGFYGIFLYICPQIIKVKNMKRNKSLIALCTLAMSMALTSCFEDNGDHYTEILYPQNGIKTLYADQTEDSLKFVTFDNWTVDTTYGAISDFQKLKVTLNPSDLAGEVQKNYYVRKNIVFQFTPNTSDTIRAVNFKLNSYNTDFGAVYQQMHFHNIDRPSRRNYQFLLTDTAEALVDSIIFVAYTDWKCTVKNPEQTNWISVGNPTGKKGTNIIKLYLEKNTGNSNRNATLVLTSSNEASTEIKLTQEKPVPKK